MNLGQILVELGINTAAFKAGLDKATYQAQVFVNGVKHSFSELGSSISNLASSFAGLDPAIGGAIAGIEGALGPLAATLGSVGGAAAGLVAAFAAAGVGAIGIAVHFSETAAKLDELSQSTGVAVEDLSLLGAVAATKGIAVESMAKALEKMDKAAFAAAQSGPKASNAFKDLGVSVTNADGSMRSAKEIFDDVSVAMSKMPDGTQKTAEAMKIFGKAGADMIPLLNEGGEKLAKLEAHFTALNAVVSGPTAQASADLKENMTLMGAAFTGIENQLTADLVPALNVVAEEFTSFFEENQDGVKAFADGLANVAKIILNVFQVVGEIFHLIYLEFYTALKQIQILAGTVGAVIGDVRSHNFGAIFGDVKKGGEDAASSIKDYFTKSFDSIKDTFTGIGKVWDASLPADKKPKPGAGEPLKAPDLTFIDKEVAALEREANKQRELAEAIGQATGSQIDATAAAEADAAIQKLRDEAAEKGIENTKAFKAALDAAIPRIQAAAEWQATFKAAISDQTEMDKFTKKIGEQIAALEGLADAGNVVERQQAKNNATLKPLADTLTELGLKYEELRVQFGDDDKRVKDLADKVASLNKQYQDEEANVKKLNDLIAQNAGKAELDQQNAKLDAMRATTTALLAGGEAYAKVATEVADYASKTGAAADKVAQFRSILLSENAEIQKQAALKLASPATSEQAANLKIQIDTLKVLEEEWKAQNKDITGVELALAQVNAEYQELQAKAGGFNAGITAGFAKFTASIKSEGEVMKDVVSNALDGVAANFTAMVSGAKTDWKGLIQSMEQALLKSALQGIMQSLFKSLSGLLGGSSNGFLSGLGSIFGGGKAVGGDVTPGKSYLVGEKGPELFSPGIAGSITPHDKMASMAGTKIEHNWYIQTPDADSFRKSKTQLMADAYSSGAQAAQRNR